MTSKTNTVSEHQLFRMCSENPVIMDISQLNLKFVRDDQDVRKSQEESLESKQH
jgi:hypothetical protein